MRILASFITVLTFAAPAPAGTIVVPDSVSTVAGALAVTAGGDTVLVQPGTYPEVVVLVDAVALIGADPGNRPILDGGGAGPVVTGQDCGSGTVFQDFVVRNGVGSGVGGGLSLKNSSLRIDHCRFEGNTALHGGGVGSDASDFTMTNCELVTNSASQTGGGVSATGLPSPVLTDCTFEGNDALAGGGLAVRNGCAPAVSGSVFDSNLADQGAGIWYDLLTGGTLTNCTLVFNDAQSGMGGGVFLASLASPTVTQSIIAFSTAGDAAFAAAGANPTWGCNDLFGNPGGDAVAGGTDLGTNFLLDPLFCDASSGGNFALQDTSPCLPGATCVLLVGALGAGNCGPVSADASLTPASWGHVKAVFH